MAILCSIREPNGIVTNYHRIALISIDVNSQNTIVVESYIDEEGRQVEKDYAKGVTDELVPPYTDAKYINLDYDGRMTIEKAYEYIKSLPQFIGSTDILV